MKISVLILILFWAIIFFITPSEAQNIRIITADTIFKGYDSGETSSIRIFNHGTNFIYNHNGKLYEMNAISFQHIRDIKLDEVKPVTKFDIDDNCKYIIYNTDSTNIIFVADYNTGKTIKKISGTYYLGYDYLYTVNCFKCPVVSIIKYDLSNLVPVDTFNYTFKHIPDLISEFKNVKPIPNTDKIIISTGGLCINRYYYNLNYSYYIIDFSNDSIQYIGFQQSPNDQGSAYSILNISEDLNYYILEKSEFDTNTDANRNPTTTYVDTDFFIHNSSYKCINNIKESKIGKLLNDKSIRFQYNGIIVENRYLAFGISRTTNGKTKNQIMIYDLRDNIPFALIDFDISSFSYNNKFIFSNKNGCLATLKIEQVSVPESLDIYDNVSLSYSNNNLFVPAKETQEVSISIMNITGVEVEKLSNIYLSEDSNTIPLNTQLANGLYFCIIKTPETTISRKFIVIK